MRSGLSKPWDLDVPVVLVVAVVLVISVGSVYNVLLQHGLVGIEVDVVARDALGPEVPDVVVPRPHGAILGGAVAVAVVVIVVRAGAGGCWTRRNLDDPRGRAGCVVWRVRREAGDDSTAGMLTRGASPR
jgi:hypothetical protein